MIAEVLNRDFVLQAMQDSLADLEDEDRRSGDEPEIAAQLEPGDLERAREELRQATTRETEQTSGQVRSQPEGEGRRGPNETTLDEAVFISTDATVSLFQSALEEYFETRHADEVESSDDGDRRGSPDQPAVADESLGVLDDDRRFLGRFEQTDIRWVNCLFAMAVRRARGRHDFNDAPAEPITVGPRFRLLLVGDWGTGLPRARQVAELMQERVRAGKEEGIEQHVVHLGDVYYSGWRREYEKRVLPYWPVAPEDAGEIGSWSLNGNHDMYSGGAGYFDFLLADPRFEQHSSWFSLENDDWKILGLDTAYDEHGLHGAQRDWVRDQVDAGSHRIFLMSHHQLFSTDPDKGGPKLREALADVLADGGITSWFWGHEHRCAVYNPNEGVGLASCVGHGGVPLYASHDEDDEPEPPAKYEYFASIDTGLERWTRMGFAILDFDGPSVAIRYVDELGVPHHEEQIAE
jgi:Calcineurin-like phosphoesterase